jgi:homopolymeric O-antigen transport system ATP-binding protein
MSNASIFVRNLSKSFKIAYEPAGILGYNTLRDDLTRLPARLLSRLRRNGRATSETFWALKDVSFDVKEGEVLGIIGRNGAGKSTLLKILGRITEPTSGSVDIYGRVGALLEVGTGFHPELTGRENIFMNGAILGMSRAEIRRKFDEIVAFAEIGKFLDTPAKRYSSGMYVRLAFAVAAHLEPEILLIDEVLAVGDAEFQKKCLGKIDQITRTQGRTALFITHNLGAIAQLCTYTIWLDDGKIRASGPSSSVVAQYLTADARRGEIIWPQGTANRAISEFKLFSIRVRNSEGKVSSALENTKPFTVEIDYAITKPLWNLRVGFSLRTSDGLCVFTTYDADHAEFQCRRAPGHYTACCEIPRNLLSPSTYLISVNAGLPGIKNLARRDNVLLLDVEDTSPHRTLRGRPGIVQPILAWKQKSCDVWKSSLVH